MGEHGLWRRVRAKLAWGEAAADPLGEQELEELAKAEEDEENEKAKRKYERWKQKRDEEDAKEREDGMKFRALGGLLPKGQAVWAAAGADEVAGGRGG